LANKETCIEENLKQVPKLSNHLEITTFDKETHLIQNMESGHNLRVKNITLQLLTLVDGKRNIGTIRNDFAKNERIDLNEKQIHDLLYGELAEYGIILSDKTIRERKNPAYLFLRINIFSADTVMKASHIFGKLFQPKLFYSTFALSLAAIFCIVSVIKIPLSDLFSTVSLLTFVYFPAVITISLLLHELGHATACRKFGANHGAIGFGFYLFRPVLYSDVSNAWKLSRSERVIIDLGGLYMETLFCLMLSFTYLISKNPIFLHFTILILMNTIYNLNPFLRFDGYWAISDISGIPNLRNRSIIKVLQFFKWIFGYAENPLKEDKGIFLVCYGLLSSIMIFVFLSFILYFYHSEIFLFPIFLYEFITQLITVFPNVSNLKIDIMPMFMSGLFYFMVFRLLISILKKQIRKTKSNLAN